MIWEATAWSAVGVVAPFLAARYWPDVRARLPSWVGIMEDTWPWLYGVAPPYFALLSGAVVARDLGLRSGRLLDFGVDLILGSLVVSGLVLAWERIPGDRSMSAGWRDLLDEPRWALYRACGGLWIGFGPAALAIGLAIALVEWTVRFRLWEAENRMNQDTCSALLRTASSTLLYSLTGSLWVTLAGQAVVVVRVGRERAT